MTSVAPPMKKPTPAVAEAGGDRKASMACRSTSNVPGVGVGEAVADGVGDGVGDDVGDGDGVGDGVGEAVAESVGEVVTLGVG